MPNLPQSFDYPRQLSTEEAKTPDGLWKWLQSYHKIIQRQWTAMVQVLNAVWKVDTAANRPTTPFLDEIAFYTSDTGVVYLGVQGVWRTINGWTGSTTSIAASDTMGSTTGVLLVDATGAAVTVTVPNDATYAGRIRAVKKVDATANIVYVSPSSGAIDGAASTQLVAMNKAVTFTSQGGNLYIVGQV